MGSGKAPLVSGDMLSLWLSWEASGSLRSFRGSGGGSRVIMHVGEPCRCIVFFFSEGGTAFEINCMIHAE